MSNDDYQKAKERAQKLRAEIERIRYDYHVLDKETVSEAAKSSLMHELSLIEEEYPDLITSDSPTQRVSGEPLPGFKKVTHARPGLSLNDIFDKEELVAWEKRTKEFLVNEGINEKPEYFTELKIDGLSVYLTYKNGILLTAATRGSGKIGEDVTANVRTIESIPLSLSMDTSELVNITNGGNVEVRGEVYMTHAELLRINKEREALGLPTYANPRNLAAGTLRQLDPKLVATRKLEFAAWTLYGANTETHEQEHLLATELGFRVESHTERCKNVDEVMKFIEKWDKPRHDLSYQTDGVVVNINQRSSYERLGMVGKAPRGSVAWKFSAEQATTRILEIRTNVGRTGAITPFAVMEPVKLAGTTVTRATLHNEDEIKRKDIRVGDTVVVQKAGDIIPEIIESLPNLRTGKEKVFEMPKSCPICGGAVSKPEGEAVTRCANKGCNAIERERIIHFVSRDAFNIEGVGEKIIEQLIEEAIITDAADLFRLTAGDLEPLERFAEKSASNLVESISEHKKVSLNRFVYALGIRFVGAITANDLANHFGSFDALKSASYEELELIDGVGPVAAGSIISWFKDDRNQELLRKLFESSVEIEASKKVSDKLSGQTFVITGSLDHMTREEAEQRIRDNGGRASGSISVSTTYLVVGDKPGSKLAKAEKLGVRVITEEVLLTLL